jgi:hypothetical protein
MTNLVLKDNYDASAPPYTAPEPVRTAYERGLVLQLFFFFLQLVLTRAENYPLQ